MTVFCVPFMIPDPEKEAESAKAASAFLQSTKGVVGICPNILKDGGGMSVVAIDTLDNAERMKARLEEFVVNGNIEIIIADLREDENDKVLRFRGFVSHLG